MIITHRKRNTTLRILLLLALILFLLLPLFVFAQETFVPLTEGGIPGIEKGTGFSGFLNAAFKLGLAVAATLAVVMITIGGFQYMGSESVFEKSAGRERIQNAIIGLLIALLIWLILFTINPNLLSFDLKVGGTRSTPTDYKSEAYKDSQQGGKTLAPSGFEATPEPGQKPQDVVDPGALGA